MTLVALGDSTTAGTPGFLSPAEAPPDGRGSEESQFAYWIRKRHPEWQVINRGVNGERSDQILKRFDSDVLAYRPGLVIILAGVNDLYQGYPAERVKENLKAIYERAVENKIEVMACTLLPYNGASSKVQARMREVNEWIRQTAEEKGLGFCDTHRVVEDPARPGDLVSTADGLHPDVAGYRKMGEAISEAIEKRGQAPLRGQANLESGRDKGKKFATGG